jgi:hypothetical protein
VKREDLHEGAASLDLTLEAHIANVIGFMRERADDLGLRGTLGPFGPAGPYNNLNG